MRRSGRAALQRQRSRGADFLLREALGGSGDSRAATPRAPFSVLPPAPDKVRIRRKGAPTIEVCLVCQISFPLHAVLIFIFFYNGLGFSFIAVQMLSDSATRDLPLSPM